MASWNHGVKYKQVTSKKLFLEIKVKRPFLSKFFRNPSFWCSCEGDKCFKLCVVGKTILVKERGAHNKNTRVDGKLKAMHGDTAFETLRCKML